MNFVPVLQILSTNHYSGVLILIIQGIGMDLICSKVQKIERKCPYRDEVAVDLISRTLNPFKGLFNSTRSMQTHQQKH